MIHDITKALQGGTTSEPAEWSLHTWAELTFVGLFLGALVLGAVRI